MPVWTQVSYYFLLFYQQSQGQFFLSGEERGLPFSEPRHIGDHRFRGLDILCATFWVQDFFAAHPPLDIDSYSLDSERGKAQDLGVPVLQDKGVVEEPLTTPGFYN